MSRLSEAFERVLAHTEDRLVLASLLKAGEEIRYEELRRKVHEDSPQMFKYTVDRLGKSALINRRLVERGRRFESYFSLTPPGAEIARVLVSLSERGTLPKGLPVRDRLELQHTFLSAVPAGQ